MLLNHGYQKYQWSNHMRWTEDQVKVRHGNIGLRQYRSDTFTNKTLAYEASS